MKRKEFFLIAGACFLSAVLGGVVAIRLADSIAFAKNTMDIKGGKGTWTPGTKGWDVSGRYIFSASTDSVGIGTAGPVYKLDVQGTGRYTGALTIGAYTLPNTEGTGSQVLKRSGAGAVSWQDEAGGVTGSGTATQVAFWSSSSALSSDAGLYWDNTNKRLGIGITPTKTLEISGDAKVSGSMYTGDLVFKNNFKFVEVDNGIALLNPKGETIAVFSENGNFCVKNKIKSGKKK